MISLYSLYKMNQYLVEEFGGAGIGFKDYNLAQSLTEQPYQEVFGEKLYPTDIDKISFMVFSIIANHIFIDGNKRTGALLLERLCYYKNIRLEFEDDELIELVLSVAKSECDNVGIKEWIEKHRL